MSKSIFEDLTLVWEEKEYVVPANRMMGLIKILEDHVSVEYLSNVTQKIEKLKPGRISGAYAAALNYAGAKVDEESVYLAIFKTPGEAVSLISSAITSLLVIMVPPPMVQKKSMNGTRSIRLKKTRKKRKK